MRRESTTTAAGIQLIAASRRLERTLGRLVGSWEFGEELRIGETDGLLRLFSRRRPLVGVVGRRVRILLRVALPGPGPPELIGNELAQVLGDRPAGLDGQDPELEPALVSNVHAGRLLLGPGRHRGALAQDRALTRERVASRCKSVTHHFRVA